MEGKDEKHGDIPQPKGKKKLLLKKWVLIVKIKLDVYIQDYIIKLSYKPTLTDIKNNM